jgi:hypothetical protein
MISALLDAERPFTDHGGEADYGLPLVSSPRLGHGFV